MFNNTAVSSGAYCRATAQLTGHETSNTLFIFSTCFVCKQGAVPTKAQRCGGNDYPLGDCGGGGCHLLTPSSCPGPHYTTCAPTCLHCKASSCNHWFSHNFTALSGLRMNTGFPIAYAIGLTHYFYFLL